MNVQVLFFAALRERAGCSELTLDVPPGTTVGALWESLCRTYPRLAPMAASVSFARNQEYVGRDELLAGGDELALIPPVSGG